jgi:pimeloyl-ACP methyl ester carboxylesterase
MRLALAVFGSLVLGLASCSSGASQGGEPKPLPDATPADPATPPPGARVAWTDCPTGFLSECATLSAPLDHGAPNGGHVDLFVAHFPAREAGGPALWLLEGGPGGSGADFASIIPLLAGQNPALDIYTLDHRGVGRSSPLDCPAEEAPTSQGGAEIQDGEWDACIAHLSRTPGLEHYNVTQAAHDLSFAIRATRKKDQPVVVYGVSYGTYWLNRYLQLHPDEPTAAIMDSVMVPELMLGPESDVQVDPIAKSWFDGCAKDAACAGKMGPDPWATLGGVYAKLRGGHCAALGMTTKLLRQTLTALFDDRDARVLSLALIHRIDRCTRDDVDAVARFYERMFGSAPAYSGYSVQLQNHILLSEFWPQTTARRSDLEAAVEASYFSPDYAATAVDLFAKWPTYTPDATAHAWHTSPRPVLVLAGTLDARTTYASQKAAEGHGTLVSFPGEGHGSITQSRVRAPSKPPCGVTIIDRFVKSGGTTVDTSCVAELAPPSFTFSEAVAQDFFGRPDIWD